jgi:hypothetical protein
MPVQFAASASCTECGEVFDTAHDLPGARTPCTRCGSTRRTINTAVQIQGDGSRLGMKFKARAPDAKKPHLEVITGAQPSVALGKPVDVQRVIDRGNDRYSETVTEYETGKVIHSDSEPLSLHVRHGSDKKQPT